MWNQLKASTSSVVQAVLNRLQQLTFSLSLLSPLVILRRALIYYVFFSDLEAFSPLARIKTSARNRFVIFRKLLA